MADTEHPDPRVNADYYAHGPSPAAAVPGPVGDAEDYAYCVAMNRGAKVLREVVIRDEFVFTRRYRPCRESAAGWHAEPEDLR